MVFPEKTDGLRGQFRRLSKPLYGKECFSMDTMFENLDFRFDKENNAIELLLDNVVSEP